MHPTNKLDKKNILLKNEEIKNKSKVIVSNHVLSSVIEELTSLDDKCNYLMNTINQQGEKIKKLEKKVEYMDTDYFDELPCFIL